MAFDGAARLTGMLLMNLGDVARLHTLSVSMRRQWDRDESMTETASITSDA